MIEAKQDRILGTFYGQALGDAMGMPSELWSRKKVQQFFGWIDTFLPGPEENEAACLFKAGEFTDDTAMAFALADALIEAQGEIDPNAIARNIMLWAEEFDAFNRNILGPSSKSALTAIKAGSPIEQLCNNGITNGAAMRVAPLGCLMPTDNLGNFIENIALASSPTHKSDISIAGAVVIAWSISKAIEGFNWEQIKLGLPSIADQAQNMHPTTFSASLASRIELALSVVKNSQGTTQTLENIYNIVGAGIATIESVPAAVALVELAKGDPNLCAILAANLGGDTDTIGAMATAICGALQGAEAIELTWREKLSHVNDMQFTLYSEEFLRLRQLKEQQSKSAG